MIAWVDGHNQQRLPRGLTRQQLADKVGVYYQTVGYLERGEYSLALALKIASVPGLRVEDLFSLTPFPDPPPERTRS